MSIWKWFSRSSKSKAIEVPRAPRVVIMPFFPLHFIGDNGTELLITNISTSGIGFQRASFKDQPALGSRITGVLRLIDKSYSLGLKVMHVSNSIVGGIIDPPSADFSRDLNGYLEVELSAVEAREVDPKFLKQESEGTPRWFVGRQSTCELFLIERNGQLQNFHCTIWGHYFESKVQGHRRYGAISQAAGQTSNIYPQSELIEDIPDAPVQLSEMVIRFIANIPTLPGNLKQQLLDRVKA